MSETTLRELANNMRELEGQYDPPLAFQIVLTEFFDVMVRKLGQEDLTGLSFSMEGGPDSQEVTLGSGDNDIVTLEFTQIQIPTSESAPLMLLFEQLNLELQSHVLVGELLLFLSHRGKFYNPIMDGSIYTCLWSASDALCSIAIFWQTDPEALGDDLQRTTPLF